MKTKIIITNRNRDGAKLWLEKVGETNDYTIHTDKKFVLEYCRIIFNNINEDVEQYDFILNDKKCKCEAFDPSGGPYISVGTTFDDKYKVIRIYRDYTDNLTKFSISKIS